VDDDQTRKRDKQFAAMSIVIFLAIVVVVAIIAFNTYAPSVRQSLQDENRPAP